MRNIAGTLLFIIALFAVSACKKSASKPTVTRAPVDVYAAGKVLAKNGNYIAAYWKNGTMIKVTDSSYSSVAESVTIVGQDVYIVGSFTNAGVTKAMYWKNGQPVILPSNNSSITSSDGSSIAVSGNNVYVTGTVTVSSFQIAAVVWVNGTMSQLTPSSGLNSYANTIAVNGGNVYITGGKIAKNGNMVAIYWQNGIAKELADSTIVSFANGIAFSGSDIYLSGYVSSNGHTTAAYWKNGQQNTLTGDSYSVALSIAVDGSDVYLGGITTTTNSQAVYWKNDVQSYIGDPAATAYSSFVSAYGNNLAISGQFGGHPSSYWFNGNFVSLTGPSAICTSIVVVPQQ